MESAVTPANTQVYNQYFTCNSFLSKLGAGATFQPVRNYAEGSTISKVMSSALTLFSFGVIANAAFSFVAIPYAAICLKAGVALLTLSLAHTFFRGAESDSAEGPRQVEEGEGSHGRRTPTPPFQPATGTDLRGEHSVASDNDGE